MKKLLITGCMVYFLQYPVQAQNIGIGTLTPAYRLDVVSPLAGVARFQSTSTSATLRLASAGGDNELIFDDNNLNTSFINSIHSSPQGDLTFYAKSNEPFTVQSNLVLKNAFEGARLGIGGIPTLHNLEVFGTTPQLALFKTTDQTGVLRLQSAGGNHQIQFLSTGSEPRGFLSVNGSGDYSFNTPQIPGEPTHLIGLRILSNGISPKVVIGGATGDGRLQINHDSNLGFPHLMLQENDATDFTRFRMKFNTGSNYWDMAGRPNATAANGSLRFYHNNGTTGTDVFVLSGTGNLTITGALSQNSDARLKKDIRPISDASARLAALNGYHYYWADEQRDTMLQTGLLAQEVESVMPELVTTNEQGIKSVNYSGVVVYLLEAIKDLKRQNDQLQAKLMQVKL